MFKLISLAMHFSPLSQSPLDPMVFELLSRELNPKPQEVDNVIELQPKTDTEASLKAA